MTFTHALATNNYGPAKFIVDASAANGTHTTIASALTSASSGDTIAIRPGTYTENLTLKAGVNLVAYGPTFTRPSSTTVPNVIISGKATFTAAGTVGIEGICLQTNSDFALSVTGSAASLVNLTNCYIRCTNNTGIQFTSSSSSSRINLNNCAGNLDTTGIAIYTHSGAGDINMVYCNFYNTGLSTTANACSGAGSILPNHCHIENGIAMSGTGQWYGVCNELVMPNNQVPMALTSTSTASLFYTVLTGNTSSAITTIAGTTLAIHFCLISSSNATTITGAGTVHMTCNSFNSTCSLDAALTLSNASMNTFISGAGVGTLNQVLSSNGVSSPPTWKTPSAGSPLVWLQNQTASASASVVFNSSVITSTYKHYVIMYYNMTAATGATTLQMQFSVDNGSNYLTTGYVANFASSTSTAAYLLSETTNDSTVGFNTGTLYLFNITTGGTPNVVGSLFVVGNTGGNDAAVSGGYGPASTTVNNIKIFASTGNIATGTFVLYGLKEA